MGLAADFYRRAYLGVNYRLRDWMGGRFAGYCRPTSISILLTNRCNARCVHCDIWKNRGREDTPAVPEWKTVLTDLRRWLGPVGIAFTGGEALLRPYTPELIAHAASLGLFVELLTHGWWEDQSRIENAALANPGRITVSLDGIGDLHNVVRGRDKFYDKTLASIETMLRVRRERGLGFAIRLKTVIMDQNLEAVHEVARFASRDGMRVFYQPVEQNYNTPEDPRWFERSANWPRDPEKAVRAVERLIALKREGLHIDNSYEQLRAMIPYFRNPAALRVSVQAHTAHEKRTPCAALTNMQIMPNGDVLACYSMPPIGNFTQTPIREMWRGRKPWWREGCCLERRCSEEEERGGLEISAGA